MTGAALPAPATLLALAHAALADQLDRDDPAHARRRLLVDLAAVLGCQVQLLTATAAAPQITADGNLLLPMRHLGHALGTLSLQPGDGLAPADTAQALACVIRTLGALLLRERSGASFAAAATPAGGTPADAARAGVSAEAQALEATERLGKIAAHVPGALFQYERQPDGSARFPYISERCTALLGVTPDEMAHDASAMLRRVKPTDREAVLRSVAQSAVAQQPWCCEFEVRRPDGVSLTVRGAATPQRQADGSALWHGYFEDVTEANARARAEHDKRLAEAANRAKTEFLSRMSHELRTPLNAVLGFAQLLALDQGSLQAPGPQHRLGLIRQSGEHLLAMIDDLLALTSIEAGRLPLTLESVPLASLVDDTLALVQVAMGRPDLQLQREGATGLAAWADRTRLRQVLINLLSNAVKYNRAGGSVRVVLAAAADGVQLQVHDTGPGLSAAELAQLFEPFNRLGQAHGAIEGTGIGLTVTRGLVQLMGGAITVQSTPGAGSCFVVRLPATPPDSPPYSCSLP